jgi:hypothetical protein
MKYTHCNYTKVDGDPERKSDQGKHVLIFLSKVFLTANEIKSKYAQMVRQMRCRYIMINLIKTGQVKFALYYMDMQTKGI